MCVHLYNWLAGIKGVLFTASNLLNLIHLYLILQQNVSMAYCTSKIRGTGKLLVFGWEKEISGHCDWGNLCIHLALGTHGC